jgi:hypothetical protein
VYNPALLPRDDEGSNHAPNIFSVDHPSSLPSSLRVDYCRAGRCRSNRFARGAGQVFAFVLNQPSAPVAGRQLEQQNGIFANEVREKERLDELFET